MADKISQNNSESKKQSKPARSVAQILDGLLEPTLARRTGMTLDLVRSWAEVCGREFSKTTRPLKIDWPRRAHEDDPFEPATLVVACEPSAALFFQHEQSSIIERVNTFFGFGAIKRIKILQQPVAEPPGSQKHMHQKLSKSEEERLNNLLAGVEDADLRAKLDKLGRGIIIAERE